jgi:integrase
VSGKARCCAVGNCCKAVPSARTIKEFALFSGLLSRTRCARSSFAQRGRAGHRAEAAQAQGRALVERRGAALPRIGPVGPRRHAAYVLILVLGLRKGEVLGLRWQAVDLEGRELVIDHQVQRVRRELLYRETKTDASDATLPMPEIVATALVIRRDEQDKSRSEAGEALAGCGGWP